MLVSLLSSLLTVEKSSKKDGIISRTQRIQITEVRVGRSLTTDSHVPCVATSQCV